MRVFDHVRVLDDEVEVDGERHYAILGKHSVWIPGLGVKLLWSINGVLESIMWERGRNRERIRSGGFGDGEIWFGKVSWESIASEWAILNALSWADMSPKVGDFVWAKSVTHDRLFGAAHNDPKGFLGYEMEDALILPRGRFTVEGFVRGFVDSGMVQASKGALGDVAKPDNEVNGYLVDVRRTIWDTMRWTGLSPTRIEPPLESTDEVALIMQSMGQFPPKERKRNYQSYYLAGRGYVDGSRDTLYRFDQMGLPMDMTGLTVLDLGCCTGAMCVEAHRRGARWVTGMEGNEDFVRCARTLARCNDQGINFLRADLALWEDEVGTWARDYYRGRPVDVVFALALYKHIGSILWRLLSVIPWRTCYLESHNAPNGMDTGHVREMVDYLKGRPDWNPQLLGQVTDRSPRYVWRLSRE